MGVIAKERAHRASLSKLMDTAEAQADAAVAILLDDLSHALSQRIDVVATVEQLRAAAAKAGAVGASPEAVADAQRQVRIQWGRLVQQSMVQVVAGTLLAAVAPASARLLLAARAAEEATALSEAARAGPAAATAAWNDDRRAAVSHRALQLMHRWTVGEALGRAIDASSRAVTTAMLASDVWKDLLRTDAPASGQEEAARALVRLSDVVELVSAVLEQLLGSGSAPAGSRIP
ncbi:hypothetical protein FNF27_06854 [Cafeteria roenbergensis]|nr:hypothetical protein FNF31_06319 [Cafeteria roenbergensis]KAA0160924.1 hypothetical protein FNF28_05271 [Cafeteria roenbergensis]KAA0169830.1 hypothetical protein FNF27_06854 [Cafeteria roenbergensis]